MVVRVGFLRSNDRVAKANTLGLWSSSDGLAVGVPAWSSAQINHRFETGFPCSGFPTPKNPKGVPSRKRRPDEHLASLHASSMAWKAEIQVRGLATK